MLCTQNVKCDVKVVLHSVNLMYDVDSSFVQRLKVVRVKKKVVWFDQTSVSESAVDFRNHLEAYLMLSPLILLLTIRGQRLNVQG